jgi:hypothetical protein
MTFITPIAVLKCINTYGKEKTMIREMIEKNIRKSQHCQRNWDLSKTIPEDDIQILKTAVTECPSKQNIIFYTPYFITNREAIEEIYKTTDGFTVSYSQKKYQTNSQTLANLLVVFVENVDYLEKEFRNEETKKSQETKQISDKLKSDMYLNLGVASGYLNLTASMLGYRTGCCQCFDSNKIRNILKIKSEPLLLMGIGYQDISRSRREHHKEDFVFPTFSKKMSVIDIK